MRNIGSAVDGSLHHSEHLGAGACAGQTNVENGSERVGVVPFLLGVVVFTGDLLHPLVGLVQLDGFQVTTSQQQSSSVGCCVVGQSNLNPNNVTYVSWMVRDVPKPTLMPYLGSSWAYAEHTITSPSIRE